jgi:hypothetical protein
LKVGATIVPEKRGAGGHGARTRISLAYAVQTVFRRPWLSIVFVSFFAIPVRTTKVCKGGTVANSLASWENFSSVPAVRWHKA